MLLRPAFHDSLSCHEEIRLQACASHHAHGNHPIISNKSYRMLPNHDDANNLDPQASSMWCLHMHLPAHKQQGRHHDYFTCHCLLCLTISGVTCCYTCCYTAFSLSLYSQIEHSTASTILVAITGFGNHHMCRIKPKSTAWSCRLTLHFQLQRVSTPSLQSNLLMSMLRVAFKL